MGAHELARITLYKAPCERADKDSYDERKNPPP
jgi:hypothetical protein